MIVDGLWVIMSKDGKKIAKGVPRHRYLVDVDNISDTKRIIIYPSKKKAEAGFTSSWFYDAKGYTETDMMAVPATLTIHIEKLTSKEEV